MRHCTSLFIFLLSIMISEGCKKDLVVVDDNISEFTSNLEETPEILYGSWNLNQNNSNIDLEGVQCNAKNIHFLNNDSYYLQYKDKRIKGTYEITSPTSINLSIGSDFIGTAANTSVNVNKISLDLEITNDCSDKYTGEKYFRIHQFIWESLNELYLWQADVDDLSDNIKPVGSAPYNQLISNNPEPEIFFESLKHPDDKHSRIRSNFEDLENSIKGIDASNGVEFVLVSSGSGNGVLGVVTHILENSNAFSKNIKRGDIFMGVNGQSLNLYNYYSLLFDDKTSYTLNMAKKINNEFTLNGVNVNLSKEENFQTNPIQLSKVIQMGGKKNSLLNVYTVFAGF